MGDVVCGSLNSQLIHVKIEVFVLDDLRSRVKKL